MALLDEVVTAATISGGDSVLPQVRYTFECLGLDWSVRSICLTEGISQLYEGSIELTCDLFTDIDPLLGASFTLLIERNDQQRRLCGIVYRLEQQGTLIDHLLIRVHVGPALLALTQIRDSRIFQEMSARDVLQKVLTDGLSPYRRTVRIEASGGKKSREYCTQYDESNYDFAIRLMSEEGIFFFFDHSGEQEELVLVDSNQKMLPHLGGPISIAAPEAPQDLLQQETLKYLRNGRAMRSTSSILRDYDWMQPTLDLTETQTGSDSMGRERSVYEYPAFTLTDGAARARFRRESYDAQTSFASCESNVTGLGAGMIIEVEQIPGELPLPLGAKYLIMQISHQGEAAEQVQHQLVGAEEKVERYRNQFTCIPIEIPYRPPLVHRPRISGPQTALVVGPAGEEVYTDEYGRIKVQFHWDREGKKDDRSSCWLRVAQSWGGQGWGFLFLPRIGMEAVVQFLDGNPDRPLITGCVYNGDNRPPYWLPDQKTQSGIKTNSSPGGNGSNELRFEDAAGSEEIFLHAQKDLKEVVEHDHSLSVGGDRTITVQGNQAVEIKGKGQSQVHSKMNVTGKHQLDASDTIEVQAPTHIKLTCGGSSVLIEPGKITLQAGDGSKLVLDANALTQSSAGAKTLHDANVLSQSVPGSKVLLDANTLTQSSIGAKVLLDANATIEAVPGASAVLDANVTLKAPVSALVQAGATATVTSPQSTLAGAGGSVLADGSGVTAAGGTVKISGGMVDVAGGLVKIN